MNRPVRVNPIFYNRLKWALDEIGAAVDAEVEFVGRHLTQAESAFAEEWDNLPTDPQDDSVRYVTGIFESVAALFFVVGRLSRDNEITIWNILIIPDPVA